jgi:hypothetical protein
MIIFTISTILQFSINFGNKNILKDKLTIKNKNINIFYMSMSTISFFYLLYISWNLDGDDYDPGLNSYLVYIICLFILGFLNIAHFSINNKTKFEDGDDNSKNIKNIHVVSSILIYVFMMIIFFRIFFHNDVEFNWVIFLPMGAFIIIFINLILVITDISINNVKNIDKEIKNKEVRQINMISSDIFSVILFIGFIITARISYNTRQDSYKHLSDIKFTDLFNIRTIVIYSLLLGFQIYQIIIIFVNIGINNKNYMNKNEEIEDKTIYKLSFYKSFQNLLFVIVYLFINSISPILLGDIT